MSNETLEFYRQVSSSLPIEEVPGLIEMLWEMYEDDVDSRDADEILRRIESGEEKTYPLAEVMAQRGRKSKYANA